jgi:hypothetical protein
MTEPVALAHYAPVKAIALSGLTAALIAALYWMVFFSEPHPMDYLLSRPTWAPFLVLSLIAALPFTWWILLLWKQLAFGRLVAVWVNDGSLKFLNGPLQSVPIGAIQSARVDGRQIAFLRIANVTIQTTRGEIKLPTSVLQESGAILRDKIQQLVRRENV